MGGLVVGVGFLWVVRFFLFDLCGVVGMCLVFVGYWDGFGWGFVVLFGVVWFVVGGFLDVRRECELIDEVCFGWEGVGSVL